MIQLRLFVNNVCCFYCTLIAFSDSFKFSQLFLHGETTDIILEIIQLNLKQHVNSSIINQG